MYEQGLGMQKNLYVWKNDNYRRFFYLFRWQLIKNVMMIKGNTFKMIYYLFHEVDVWFEL